MKHLGHLETAVMRRLWEWDRPAASVREVLDGLKPNRDLAYTTVMTVLDNLHGKGLVRREKEGRAYVYAPTITREAYTADLLGQVLEESEDRAAALLHFVGTLSADEIATLRSALVREEGDPTL